MSTNPNAPVPPSSVAGEPGAREPGNDFPRRIKVYEWTDAERAIKAALEIVEGLGADVRLTDAVVLLGAAQTRVADFIDGIDGYRTVPCQSVEHFSPALPSTAAHNKQCSRHGRTNEYLANDLPVSAGREEPAFALRRSIPLDDETISAITNMSLARVKILRVGGIAQVSENERQQLLVLSKVLEESRSALAAERAAGAELLDIMQKAHSLIDQAMGDTDPLDDDDPLLRAAILLAPAAARALAADRETEEKKNA